MSFPVLAIPNATDIPSQSQKLIQDNFTSLIGWAAIDHIGYGAVNSGTHNQVTILQATTPVPSASTTAGVIYTVTDSAGASQLRFVNKNGVASITGLTPQTGTDSTGGSYQLFQTPWGQKYFTGQLNGIGANNVSITLVGTSSFGGTIYTQQATAVGVAAKSVAMQVTPSSLTFSISAPGTAGPVSWFVISN